MKKGMTKAGYETLLLLVCVLINLHAECATAIITGEGKPHNEAPNGERNESESENNDDDNDAWDVNEVIGEVVKRRFIGCHLLVLSDGDEVFIITLIRLLMSWSQPLVIADPWTTSLAKDSLEGSPEDFLRGDGRSGCRVVIISLMESPSSDAVIRFLTNADLWNEPDTTVLVVGPSGKEENFLSHHAFRNTIHALFFSPIPRKQEDKSSSRDAKYSSKKNLKNFSGVNVYLRCFFCDSGKSQVIQLDKWYPWSGWIEDVNLFPDQFRNFNGHLIRVVTKSYFPFAANEPDSDEPGSTVTLRDSLDMRMLSEMGRRLNFTFEARLPADGFWGLPTGNGSWTGIVGMLHREEADFSTCLYSSAERIKVADFTRMYVPDPLIIVTHKPKSLPSYLAIVKPFSPILWAAVAFTCVVVGLVFWLLQKAWKEITENSMCEFRVKTPETYGLSASLFNTWAILIEQTPFKHPTHLYGRLWETWWVVFSLITLTMYKSSLMASLSVPQLSKTVDTLQQLLEQEDWTWGIEPGFGLGWRWLKESDSPDVRKISRSLEVLDAAEQMDRVSEGKHAFFTWTNYVRALIASSFIDRNGYTPFHISRERFLNTGCIWGCRKGAPFLRTIVEFQQDLLQGSFQELWLDDIFLDLAKKARRKKTAVIYEKANEKRVVLSMYHLQGAFYLLFIGLGLALMVLMMETLKNR